VILLLAPAGVRAAGGAVLCADGPCLSPTAVAYAPGQPPLAVANFGLLLSEGPGDWQFVCDDLYGTPAPELVRVDARGRLFAPARGGLRRSADGCAWDLAGGDLAGQAVLDLAFDPAQPDRMWALAGPESDRALALSTDGGATFQLTHHFDGNPYTHLLVAPSDARRMYALAADGATTWLAASSDGGGSWTARDLSEGMPTPPPSAFSLMAVAPADPDRLYFSLVDAYGDELWLSEDGGRTLRRVLKGGARDWLTGLAFGAGQTVYAGAAVVPVLDGAAPGHLYISRDGGRSWGEAIDAGMDGPAFRCLRFSDGKLYACTGETFSTGSFLVAASEDEGRTWTPIVRLKDLTGVKACARSRCAASETWLCDTYGHCPGTAPDAAAPDAPAGDDAATTIDAAGTPAPDAGGADTPTIGPQRADGCGCSTPRPRPRSASLLLLLLALVPRLRSARRPRL
jgi:hypothetical protein